MSRIVLSYLIAAIGLGCWCASADAAESIERSVPADARGMVEIVNIAGDVRVLGWDRNEVQIRGVLSGSAQQLEVQSSNGRTVIVIQSDRGRGARSAQLNVQVPLQSTVSINTVSADQTIEGLRGVQRLQAVSGTITTEQWSEDLEAKTISGDIVIRGHGGTAQAALNTVSGQITLTGAPANLSVETVTGDMDIAMDQLDRARIRNTNGDLQLRAKLLQGARLDAEAVNGSLRFIFAEPLDAQFEVETFNGKISNCFGPKPQRTREHAPGNSLRFTQGSGAARVRIKTLNGTVDMCTN